MNTKLISFFTKDWIYPKYAVQLKKECEALKMPCEIRELTTTGSYLKNTCMKPQFILDMLKELKCPVLWVDVDGSLRKYPELFEKLDGDDKVDFSARLMPENRDRTWHVGTMWFNYTPAMISFLEEWIKNTGAISDESALEKTWQDNGFLINTFELPQEYFIIEKVGRPVPTNTVIMHRLSRGESKRREEPKAIADAKKGIY